MKPGDEPPLLTFQWQVRDHPLARLTLFVFLSIVGAAGFFLLFKVVYPQARRYSTAPQQVMVLDPTQAATRDIVNRTSDENFLLLSPDSDPARAGAEARELFPVFRPGFAGFEMKLMDLPGEQDEKTLPRVYRIDDMPMPPLATVMKAQPPVTSRPAAGPAVLRVVLHGDLAKRELATSRDVSGLALADSVSPRFRLCVNHAGLVTFALPVESSADAKQMRALHKSLSMLRFKPVKNPATQWGEASFAWENTKP